MNLTYLIRKILREFKGYTSEIHTVKLTDKLGLKKDDIIKLDANENLFLDQQWIKRMIIEAAEEASVSVYTDTACTDLREAIGKFHGLKSEEIVVGSGADGIVDNITKLFLEPGAEALVLEPTYSIYKLFIRVMGAKYTPVLLNNDFSLNAEKVLRNISQKTKIIFLCSPNNPTGNQFSLDDILTIIEESGKIVVLDEAYADFGKYSLLKAVREYNNLIIVRTFSKAFGLASLRIGYAVTNEELSNLMLQVAFPYPVNIIGQHLVPKLFQHIEVIFNTIKQIKVQREILLRELQDIEGIEPYNSDANFILFRVTKEGLDCKEVHQKLLEQGIIVRDRSSLPMLDNCLRVTVPPETKRQRFVSVLKNIVEK
ncbi:MAG: histidinol-phosphate transaminase [Candidatus Odinarchaeia archaeon]